MTCVPAVTALYAPGDRPGRFANAVDSGADVVIVDLEDAVAPDGKERARSAAREFLSVRQPIPVQVRVNGLSTPWGRADVEALVDCPGLAGLRVPKVERPGDLAEIGGLAPGVPLHGLLESALGVESAYEIAGAGGAVASIGLGEADLAGDLGVTDRSGLDWCRSRVVVAARAAGLPPPMMSVWTGLDDPDGLARSSRAGRAMGFFGRAAIHPAQLATIVEAFTPTPAEVEWARAILASLDAAGAAGSGVGVLPGGQMVDAAMRTRAVRVLAVAARLAERASG